MTYGMNRVFIGGISASVTRDQIEAEFGKFGKLNNVWVAKNPPGFAFVVYDDNRDAEEAVKSLNGARLFSTNEIRVEHSRNRPNQGGMDRRLGGGGMGGGPMGQISGRLGMQGGGGMQRSFRQPRQMMQNDGFGGGRNDWQMNNSGGNQMGYNNGYNSGGYNNGGGYNSSGYNNGNGGVYNNGGGYRQQRSNDGNGGGGRYNNGGAQPAPYTRYENDGGVGRFNPLPTDRPSRPRFSNGNMQSGQRGRYMNNDGGMRGGYNQNNFNGGGNGYHNSYRSRSPIDQNSNY